MEGQTKDLASILRTVGEGTRFAELDAESRHALGRLETDTVQFWDMPSPKRTHSLKAKCQLWQSVYPLFEARRRQQLATPPLETLWQIHLPLAQWVVDQGKGDPRRRMALGISGAQGSGKSTLCALLQPILETGFKQRVTVLSLDDLYLTRTERECLARRVHPLFVTRGVPGTHDVAWGVKILCALRVQGGQVATPLPVFDKAADDRIPMEKWPTLRGRPDILLFEGWCIGARPEPPERLTRPVNLLEAEEDSWGIWRRYVNQVLGEQYHQLFRLLDRLIFLKIPEFRVVYSQRLEQEQRLVQAFHREGQRREMDAGIRRTMNSGELQRFIMHFQRLTEYMLEEMPERADLVLEIDKRRQFRGVKIK